MVSLSVGIIVELHLGGVLAQYFNVDLIPRIVLRRAGVRKERGYHTVVFDCLHGGFVVAVGIVVVGAVLTAGIIILACGILVDAQVQCAVLHHGIFRIPSAVKRIAVRPAVRRKEQRRFSRTEICNRIGGGVHRCAVVLDGVGRCVQIRSVLLVSHPLVPCSQRCCAVKRLQPAVHADSRPCVHHDSSGR